MKKRIVFLAFIGFACNPFLSFSQGSIPAAIDITENKNLEFQEFFFKSLSEKAINNYQKAIDNLDNCNQIIPNNKAVLFELSKNYFKLNRFFEAVEYGNKALEKDSQNVWILEHLVAIHKKNRNFTDAIKHQLEITKKHPKKKQKLVFLYLQNSNYSAAKQILQELEDAKISSSRLREIKDSLIRRLNTSLKEKSAVKIKGKIILSEQFENDKSFTTLKKLLEQYDLENHHDLLKYSQRGLDLFPAQPFVYLMNGKALNKQKSFTKAIESLQNGIDFVIDNDKMEANFFIEIAKAYQGLGKPKEAQKYRKKVKK